VLANCTLLACPGHSIRVCAPSGLLSLLARRNNANCNQDGQVADARFNCPDCIKVSPTSYVVVVDHHNHALRLVSKAGVVSILAGVGGGGFEDGQGAAARFN
jgi:hypothetical protein